MNKKTFVIAAALGAASAGLITGCLLYRRKCKPEPELEEDYIPGLDDEEDDDPGTFRYPEFTKEIIRSGLENLFSLYDEEELSIAVWSEADEGAVAAEAAREYAPAVYRYMKRHMKQLRIFDSEEELKCVPVYGNSEITEMYGIRICSSMEEVVFDRFDLYNTRELWLLENGEAVQLRCIHYRGAEGDIEYRYPEVYIKYMDDCSFTIEDIIDDLNTLLSRA